MKNIHSTAIIEESVVIGEGTTVGPYCVLKGNVKLGNNNKLMSGVVIEGDTTIGNGNTFFHYSVLGSAPQDLKYDGAPTRLNIGDNNTVREFATINRSASLDEDVNIGSNNLFMAYTHIAHNCQIGNNIIMANAVNLAGHITIKDYASIGGMTAVHQFVTIGQYAFVGGASGVKKDVPPYTRGEGMPYKLVGLNSVGLDRKGFSKEQIADIKRMYKTIYGNLNVTQAIQMAEALPDVLPEAKVFLDFVKNSKRGICRSRIKG